MLLRRHRIVKARLVQAHVLTHQDVGCQVDRESECVIQLEHRFTGQLRGTPSLEFANFAFEQMQTLRKRFQEALLFSTNSIGDVGAAFLELRVGFAHLIDHGVGHAMHEGSFTPEELPVA